MHHGSATSTACCKGPGKIKRNVNKYTHHVTVDIRLCQDYFLHDNYDTTALSTGGGLLPVKYRPKMRCHEFVLFCITISLEALETKSTPPTVNQNFGTVFCTHPRSCFRNVLQLKTISGNFEAQQASSLLERFRNELFNLRVMLWTIIFKL